MMEKRKFILVGEKNGQLTLSTVQVLPNYLKNHQVIIQNSTFVPFLHFRYCTDTKTTFTTSVTLKNHISLMHGIKNPDLGQMPKTAVQESKKALGKVVFFPPNTNNKIITGKILHVSLTTINLKCVTVICRGLYQKDLP